MTFWAQDDPSGRVSCTDCGRRIQKGDRRLKAIRGEFGRTKVFNYYCRECGIARLDRELRRIRGEEEVGGGEDGED